MTLRIFGIANCDKVRRARAWFAGRHIPIVFIDYKTAPPTAALITGWLQGRAPDDLINRAGTTWRKLTDAEKARAETPAGAVKLMIALPSLIRRPIVVDEHGTLTIGADAEVYEATFGG